MRAYLKSSLRWLFVAGACLLAPLVFAVSLAWACVPASFGGPSASPPSMALQPVSGVGGSTTTVTGKSFPSGPVEIRWDSTSGPLLASTTGPDFSTSVTIPDVPSGAHTIFAFGHSPGGVPAAGPSASFQVTPTPSTPTPVNPTPGAPASPVAPVLTPTLERPPGSLLPAPDAVGPAIAGAALTRANGTRTVSPNGEVWVFCGRFTEVGVSGSCGASSAGPLTQVGTSRPGKTARSIFLRLATKTFHAEPGRPVMLKFRLTKSNLKMLIAAKTVRMSGTVDARDASGKFTSASFGLTLRAATARSHR